jgi:hypothetical protein
MKMGAKLLLLAALCVQILSPVETRTLSGIVTNDGEPIKGAVVQIENCATLQLRSFITQQDGGYHFAGLLFDVDYQVWAKRGAMESKRKTLSQFNGKKDVKIDLVLQ